MCSCVSERYMFGLCLLFNVDIQFLIVLCCQPTKANVKYTNGKIAEKEYLWGEHSCSVLLFDSVFWVMANIELAIYGIKWANPTCLPGF